MPISGGGAVPASGSVYNELNAATRRAFVPNLIVNLYYSSPSWFYMLGNSQRSAGGLNQITIPVQGQSMVAGQFTGYGGGFNSPVVIPGIQNAQFSTCYWVVPVPLPFGETILQATEREVSILNARMNDVYSVTVQNCASLMFSNNSANSLLPNSFFDAYDAGASVATYGGINRTTAGNTFWQGQTYTASTGSGNPGTSGFTRETMSRYITQITTNAGGEHPTCVIMSPGDWQKLNEDFIGTETIFNRPGQEYDMGTAVRTAFNNLNVNGVPVYADFFCPQGTCYFINTKYTTMYVDENAFMEFSGFYSLVPLGQIGQQGVMAFGYNIVTGKPVSGGKVTGIASPAF